VLRYRTRPFAGEAVYVDDIPSPPRCLHAAFVISTEPFAKLNGVDTEAALQSEGAVDYISVRDIPEGGKNIGSNNPWVNHIEPLFAEGTVNYVTEAIGVVVS
jgi:xanthine dehydrogenase molybdopterin-binding subunit B